MRKILHLSDLHFGRLNPGAIESLHTFLVDEKQNLDLMIVTGDWTQRARTAQFQEARNFVDRMSIPVVSVPGNHDVPLYQFWERFVSPLRKYDRHLSNVTVPHFVDEEIVVAGISTLNRGRVAEGRLNSRELKKACELFQKASASHVRILACHHAIFDTHRQEWLGPSKHRDKVMQTKPDLILSGHSHLTSITPITWESGHSSILISAGTVISERLREEANSLHVIEVEAKQVQVRTYSLGEKGFVNKNPQPRVYPLQREVRI